MTALLDILRILDPILRVTAVPGLQDAATILSEVVRKFIAISEAEVGWKRLAIRLEHLNFLLKQVDNEDSMEDSVKRILEPVSRGLHELAEDLRKVQNSDRSMIAKFFASKTETDSIAVYEKILDQVNASLTIEVSVNTNLTVRQIHLALNRISEKIESFAITPNPFGSFAMRDNTAHDVNGSASWILKFNPNLKRVLLERNSVARIGRDVTWDVEMR